MNQIFSNSSCLRYRLFPFPTEKKNPEKRNNWKKLLNRQALHGEGLWEPSKDSRICSRHFVDGEPTLVNPNPTLNMGYKTTSRALLCSPPTGKRKCTEKKGWINLLRTKTSKLGKTQKKEATKDNIPGSEAFDDELQKNETVDFDLFDLEESLEPDIIGNINARNQENEDASTLNRKCTEEKGWINLIGTKASKLEKTQKNKATKDNILDSETFDDELEINETVDLDKFDLRKSLETDIIHNIDTKNQENEDASSLNTPPFHITFDLLLIILSLLLLIIKLLYEKVLTLEGKIKEMENEKKQPFWKKILSSQNCSFLTNIDNIELFHTLHDKVAPLVRRRYRYKDESQPTRLFQETPKKMGRERKLDSKDEFLLTFMKLRLGLLNQDLAQRFAISESLVTNIFHSWLRAMAEYLSAFVYMPDTEHILGTTPQRFRAFKNLCGIIDCSEIFIEIPKDLEMQSATWSEYKHHNTVKSLICVAPNSGITFISKAYTGRLSDKKITLESGFLDHIPQFTTIMADKGFNLIDECTARNIYFEVPPGKRGITQMTPSHLSKTSSIAKVLILVEQVIRCLKTFRILSNEIPISLLEHINDMLIVCAAICNFKEPLYFD